MKDAIAVPERIEQREEIPRTLKTRIRESLRIRCGGVTLVPIFQLGWCWPPKVRERSSIEVGRPMVRPLRPRVRSLALANSVICGNQRSITLIGSDREADFEWVRRAQLHSDFKGELIDHRQKRLGVSDGIVHRVMRMLCFPEVLK